MSTRDAYMLCVSDGTAWAARIEEPRIISAVGPLTPADLSFEVSDVDWSKSIDCRKDESRDWCRRHFVPICSRGRAHIVTRDSIAPKASHAADRTDDADHVSSMLSQARARAQASGKPADSTRYTTA